MIPDQERRIAHWEAQYNRVFADMDRLRKALDVSVSNCAEAFDENQRLRAENADLRKQIIGKDTQLQDMENDWDSDVKALRARVAELEEALQEILDSPDDGTEEKAIASAALAKAKPASVNCPES